MAQEKHTDVIIIGAGGAGLMCAMEAGKRGRKTLVLDHGKKIGRKILISGGGRCNFTNLGAEADRYISGNKHFCKSAFSQYTQHDFIKLVEKHKIKYHEKKLGQQFTDTSAQDIVDMLVHETQDAGAKIVTDCSVTGIQKMSEGFKLETSQGVFTCESLVIATGGLAIPKIGATDFGYKVAKQFGLEVVTTDPALVPFTFDTKDLELYEGLSGISIDSEVSIGKRKFRENVLITHRGVSGPAILQISSYWQPGMSVKIHMLPDVNLEAFLKEKRTSHVKSELKTVLGDIFPKRFITALVEHKRIKNPTMAQLSDKYINQLVQFFGNYTITPNGTEGYKKAEVTRGGVHTKELDARTLASKKEPNLYFIGEVVDVTGWLGGYNFQWAWSSGFAAGQVV